MGGGDKKGGKPRGKKTAYNYFVQDCREQHKNSHPGEKVVFSEFSKECAQRWKSVSENQKKRFKEMAEEDKDRYQFEMEGYVPPKGEKGGKKKGGGSKKIKDPNAPKRPLSAFFWFSNDERAKVMGQNPGSKVGEVAKILGRMWSEIDPASKFQYQLMAERDKARYDKEMAIYKDVGGGQLSRAIATAVYDFEESFDEDEDSSDE